MKVSTRKTITNKTITLIAASILALGLLTSCGSTSDESATTEATTEKATVTAGEAAEKESSNKEVTTAAKTGTEDPAIDAVKAYAEKNIKGFDGSWENVEMEDFEDTIVFRFEYKGNHYEYTYDVASGKITE